MTENAAEAVAKTAVLSTDEVDRERLALGREMADAGWLFFTGAQGVRGLGENAEAVLQGLIRCADAARASVPRPGALRLVHFPAVNARSLLEKTDYVASFPQLIGTISGFEGGNADHKRILDAHETGGQWDAELRSTAFALVPAACHPLYDVLANSVADGTSYGFVSDVFRNEPSDDPFRMVTFRVHESVLLGTPEQSLAYRNGILVAAEALLRDLGLTVVAQPANDPFFGRAGRMLAKGQLEQELKFEILVETFPGHPTAIGSANYHQDHFGEQFGITLPDGSPAHSACFGFGLERIMLALVKTHGTDLAAWPRAVREKLNV